MNQSSLFKLNFVRIILIILIAFTFHSPTSAQVVSTFDSSDISQWILEGDGSLSHDASVGLSGGCIRFDDPATGIVSVMTIPPAYLGMWNDDGQEISFDMHIVTSDNDIIDDFAWVIEISGPGGVAHALPEYIPELNEWVNINVPIADSAWTIQSGTWEDILENVNQVRIRVEYISGLEDVYFDNVSLSFTPEVNEINGDVCSDFETYGFDGWTFDDVGAITYTDDSGNPGGAIKISDASGDISMGSAPWKFLGDWSVLGTEAVLNFDLRVNSSGSLYMEKEFLIRISGSGGTAIIPADYDEIDDAVNQWKSFSFPIDSSTWTVTSGTWENILSSVQLLELELEFIDGTETVYLDNICLITDNEISCIADGGTISTDTASVCSKQTYNMSSVGYSTESGTTYQWMRSTVSGGPYTNVTGGSGATTTSYTTGSLTTGTYYYVMQTTCADSGTDLSNELTLIVNSLPASTITPAGSTTFCSGDSVVLNAPVAANRSYQWKKGNANIAGATSSSYTATSNGKYKVVVTNTLTGCSKTSASLQVTVSPLPIASITPGGPTTFCAGDSVVLQANTGTGLTYKWKKGATYISGATSSSYTATTTGNYKVEVTNASGCVKLSSGVSVNVTCKNSIHDEGISEVYVYPNPTFDMIHIMVDTDKNFEIEILNTTGQVVFRGQNITSFDMSTFAADIYFIKISTVDSSVTQKIIKQ